MVVVVVVGGSGSGTGGSGVDALNVERIGRML